MLNTLVDSLKKQRMAWSWAVVVGLFLIVAGHAPILPVMAGGVLAVTMSALRSASRSRPRPILTRGDR